MKKKHEKLTLNFDYLSICLAVNFMLLSSSARRYAIFIAEQVGLFLFNVYTHCIVSAAKIDNAAIKRYCSTKLALQY